MENASHTQTETMEGKGWKQHPKITRWFSQKHSEPDCAKKCCFKRHKAAEWEERGKDGRCCVCLCVCTKPQKRQFLATRA